MVIQKAEKTLGKVGTNPGSRVSLSKQALQLLEKAPDNLETNRQAVKIARELKKEVRKSYPDLEALKTANEIECFIKSREPGAESIVLC